MIIILFIDILLLLYYHHELHEIILYASDGRVWVVLLTVVWGNCTYSGFIAGVMEREFRLTWQSLHCYMTYMTCLLHDQQGTAQVVWVPHTQHGGPDELGGNLMNFLEGSFMEGIQLVGTINLHLDLHSSCSGGSSTNCLHPWSKIYKASLWQAHLAGVPVSGYVNHK